jgi:hypothetical protein
MFQSNLLGSHTKPCLRNMVLVQHSRDPNLLILSPGSLGDVICLHVFDQVIVVLSSLPAIKDLLEKRGEKYADRPMLPIQEMYASFGHFPLSILRP